MKSCHLFDVLLLEIADLGASFVLSRLRADLTSIPRGYSVLQISGFEQCGATMLQLSTIQLVVAAGMFAPILQFARLGLMIMSCVRD